MLHSTIPHTQFTALPAEESELKLIDVLKSDSPIKEKYDACRALAHIGTEAAVPTLVSLLDDEKLSHMARYGLETIPDPSADDALRDALGKVKGLHLVGVIGSIGVRRDTKAVDSLTKCLGNSDPAVVKAAALALGRIATVPAGRALIAALDDASPSGQLWLCEGLFRCAESLHANGFREDALEIYDRIRRVKAPYQIRVAALRGSVFCRETGRIPLLLEALHGDDDPLAAGAAQIAQELPGSGVTKALSNELPKLPLPRQILSIQALAKRADATALPALLSLAQQGEKEVRLEAIRAFPPLGDKSALSVLEKLQRDPDSEIAQTAEQCFMALSG